MYCSTSRSFRPVLAGSALLFSTFGATLPGCEERSQQPAALNAKEFFPKVLPDAPAQAKRFIEQIESAQRSGKPVVAWVKVYHDDPIGVSAEVEKKAPGIGALMKNFIAESQFEATWFHMSFQGPALAINEGAKTIEGVGDLGVVTREATQFLYSRLFPSGLPDRFEDVTDEQKAFLVSPGSMAAAFGTGKIDTIYPAGDPHVLDLIEAKIEALKTSYGGVVPHPWPEEYRSLLMDAREEALVAYAQALSSRPEHKGKVLVVGFGTKHKEIPRRFREVGFEVVELDCSTALETFLKDLAEKARRSK